METAELLDTLTPAGRRVLGVAAGLFYRQGIHAVGVEAIAAEAGVTKKTLYACFGSKDRLVTAYVLERDQRWRQWLTRWVDERCGSGQDKLLGVFDALGAWIDRDDFRGCAFVNALAELPAVDHPAHTVIVEQKRWMRDYLERLARQAEAADPEGVAHSALLLYEGATVAASASMPDAVSHARKTAATLLV